jgi:ADP-ribose pyrophosphatase YjhB (NUDIX family)
MTGIREGVDGPEALAAWLAAHDVDLSRWGTGAAKRVRDLWAEIARGESQLQPDPLLRRVAAVVVLVRRGDRALVETEQALRDGRTRPRHRPPSEKMKPGEGYRDAAVRCLVEEIGVRQEAVAVLEATHEVTCLTRASASYPGLRTRYVFHTVEVQVDGLPAEGFSTREAAHGAADPIRRHHWAWAPVASLSDPAGDPC